MRNHYLKYLTVSNDSLMTRDEYRRKMVRKRQRVRIGAWALFVLSSPMILILFLGDILATPFVKSRHQSNLHWLLYMFARFMAPLIILGSSLGYLLSLYK